MRVNFLGCTPVGLEDVEGGEELSGKGANGTVAHFEFCYLVLTLLEAVVQAIHCVQRGYNLWGQLKRVLCSLSAGP